MYSQNRENCLRIPVRPDDALVIRQRSRPKEVDPNLTPTQDQISCVKLVELTTRLGAEAGETRLSQRISERDPTGIRTRVFAVRGRCPWPLDDGAASMGEDRFYTMTPLSSKRRSRC